MNSIGRPFLPFKFNVVHVLGRTMGMADFLSRHLSENSSIQEKN